MIMSRVLVAVGVGATMLLTVLVVGGCASRVGVSPEPAATPYDGPLRVEQTEPPTADRPDRGGAAGLAVQCRGEPTGRNRGAAEHAGEVFQSAEGALREALRSEWLKGPLREYRKVAESGDRVMYRYEPEGAAKHALVSHFGDAIDGNTGWYIESSASCDPAEFPDAVTRQTEMQIWTDATGSRVLTTEIYSSRGPQHCNWEHMTFLLRGGSRGLDWAYVANAGPELAMFFAEPYQPDLPLPADAVDSGFHLGDDHLWFSPDGMRAYVGTPEQVQLWPRTVKSFGCA